MYHPQQEMTAFQKELHDHKHYFNMKVNDLQALLSSQDLKVRTMQKDMLLHYISDRLLKIIIYYVVYIL